MATVRRQVGCKPVPDPGQNRVFKVAFQQLPEIRTSIGGQISSRLKLKTTTVDLRFRNA